MEIKLPQKNPINFECKNCNFICNNKKDYNRHLLTRKHLKEINGNIGNIKPQTILSCEKCNKKFKSNSGLWKHKKKCSFEETKEETNE